MPEQRTWRRWLISGAAAACGLAALALAAGTTAAGGASALPPQPSALPWLGAGLLLAPLALGQPLPGTQPLEMQGDLSMQMVAGIDRYLTRETATAAAERERHWKRDLSSPDAYEKSLAPNRERLRKILGVVDERVPFDSFTLVQTLDEPALVARGAGYRVFAVRWPVLRGVDAEGLLLQPERPARANVIALPDADWTPEMLVGLAPGVPAEAQFARRLAESGCRVLIPALISRSDAYSGNPAVRFTNQPHREFVYRGAFEMGRSIVGYEVQKVLAAVDWFQRASSARRPVSIGVAGYGEGGLVALYSAALDERIDGTLVSGYFGPREELFSEPIYRNVWSLLREFGDAELASMVAPRPLVIEASPHPKVAGPPPAREGRSGAAPGALTTPPLSAVEAEVERARKLTAGLKAASPVRLVGGGTGRPGSAEVLQAFLGSLDPKRTLAALGTEPKDQRKQFDPQARQKRQFDQLVEHVQHLMREGEFRRRELWAKADGSSVRRWQETARPYRDMLWREVIGKLPDPAVPLHPRTRLVYDEPKYRGYEVVLDVYPDVYAYGILLVPKDVKEGERRPVVVCQHGLEGRPQDVADPKVDSAYYHQFAIRLAERGFVTFSPQNPYIGGDKFRVLQRKANPLGLSLFSFIIAQHGRIVDFLAAQPYVDPQRIAFYGLSYGGKTAMRVPAIEERYCLSICSGDYNEWIWKNVSTRSGYSYIFTGEYEMFEFNLGNTFNYAEMAWLICPRPFMVERGHDDGVAPDEWVAYEFAKAFQRYDRLGIGDRCTIEYFNGPHHIEGKGTYKFLHQQLKWPEPR